MPIISNIKLADVKSKKKTASVDTTDNASTVVVDNSTSDNATTVTGSSSRTRKSRRVSRPAPQPAAEAPSQLVTGLEDDEELYNVHGFVHRKSDLCCGSCCDVRKACIIMDVIFFPLMIVHFVLAYFEFAAIYMTLDSSDLSPPDDDDHWRTFTMARALVGIPIAGIGLYGALKFRRNWVLALAIWHCFYSLSSGVTLRVVHFIVGGVFAYPQFALYFALRNEKITPENYQQTEEYCCWHRNNSKLREGGDDDEPEEP